MYDEFQTQQFWDNMKKSQLKQLIKEEFNKILNEENKLTFNDIDDFSIESEDNYSWVENTVLDTFWKEYPESMEAGRMGNIYDLVDYIEKEMGGVTSDAKKYIEQEVYKNEKLRNSINKFIEDNQ
jgi:hypothetical protein